MTAVDTQSMTSNDVVKRRNILILYFAYLPSSYALGPATSIENLVEEIKEDFSVTIVSLNYDFLKRKRIFSEESANISLDGGINVIYLQGGIARYFDLYRILKSGWHCVLLNCGYDFRLALPSLILLWLRGLSDRVIHFPHGIFLKTVMSKKPARKQFFVKTARFMGLFDQVTHLAASESEKVDIIENLGGKQNVVVLPHFIRNLRYAREITGKRIGSLRICLIGRVTDQKNILYAIEIIDKLEFECTLDVFGDLSDQDYVDQCRLAVARLDAKKHVEFKGVVPQSELMATIYSYDIMFLPTKGENFGHAIIEALSQGLPALVSDRCPWRDLQANGAGWSVPLADVGSFCAILNEAYCAGSEWRVRREAATRYAEGVSERSWLVEAYLSIFNNPQATNAGGR